MSDIANDLARFAKDMGYHEDGPEIDMLNRAVAGLRQLAAARSALGNIETIAVSSAVAKPELFGHMFANIARIAKTTLAQDPAGQSEASVRALDWQETVVDRGDGSNEPNGWEADSGFGLFYSVEMYFGSDSFGFRVSFDHELLGDVDDPDIAKAIAQKDFELRAKSILALLPAGSASPGGTAGASYSPDVGKAISQFAAKLAVLCDENLERSKRNIEHELLELFAHLARPYLDRAVAAEAALAAHPTVKVSGDAAEWQTIETAPKDGTPVLLASVHPRGTKQLIECSWWSAERCAAHEGGNPDDFEAGWYQVEDIYDSFCHPTHWRRPLARPLTPAQSERDGGAHG